MIECPICKKSFRSLSGHVKRVHKIDKDLFKNIYPDIQLTPEDVRARMSESSKKSGCGKWIKGRKASDEEKKRMSERNRGARNPFYGQRHSKETKQKMKNNHADFYGDKNPFKIWMEDGYNKANFICTLENIYEERRKRNDSDYKEICKNASERVSKLHKDGKLFSYGRGHLNGCFIGKNRDLKIYFRSSYEYRFLVLCERNNLIFGPSNLSIPYINPKDYHTHNYLPDFIINEKIVVEVKPHKLLNNEINKLKFKYGKKYCKENNLKYKIVTEKELELFEKNSEALKKFLEIG